MEYQSNNNRSSAAFPASNGIASSIASNPASDSKNRKPQSAQQLVRENVQYLIEQLEAGHTETLTAYLDAMAHFSSYSLGNILLVARQKPEATNVAGMRAWNELGRRVKRGEKGIAILAPIAARSRKEDTKSESETESGSPRAVLGFRRVYVWDISSTEGKPLPDMEKVTGNVGANLDRLREYVSTARHHARIYRKHRASSGHGFWHDHTPIAGTDRGGNLHHASSRISPYRS